MQVAEQDIYITNYDLKRLEGLLAGMRRRINPGDRGHLARLAGRLKSARVVPQEYIPQNMITMNSRFRIRFLNTGEEKDCQLVFPAEADYESGRISILSLLGSALLGRKAGDTVRYEAPAGWQELRVEEIVFQPEAEGDFVM